MSNKPILRVEEAVKQRYSAAAKKTQPSLCCSTQYHQPYLEIIPSEIVERDYGCGDPSQYLHPGETVLDLGSGTGKICYIAAQIVGPTGHVIGVDMNDDMLALARKYQKTIAEKLGYSNVEFRKGRIQDLALNLEKLDEKLAAKPILSAEAYLELETLADQLRQTEPLIASDSIDVVVSNCVLNLVDPRSKKQLFHEIFRVLRKGGRAVISDITSNEDVPLELQNDPELWSGCISGAFREDLFLKAFEEAGFYGIQVLKRDEKPWQTVKLQGLTAVASSLSSAKPRRSVSAFAKATARYLASLSSITSRAWPSRRRVKGIEFRGLIVEAYKGKQGPVPAEQARPFATTKTTSCCDSKNC